MRIFLGMRQDGERDPDEWPETFASNSIVKVIDWLLDFQGGPSTKEEERLRRELMDRLEAAYGEVMFIIQCLVV